MDAEQKLREIIDKLRLHRQEVKHRGFTTAADEAKERRLLRAYRRLVECGCCPINCPRFRSALKFRDRGSFRPGPGQR